VVASITAGFEAVNAQLGLILLPLVLDLFLWLGPRLSVLPLMQQLVQAMEASATGPDAASMRPMIESVRQTTAVIGDGFNLFRMLSTTPLGVPSLMAARFSAQTPSGPSLAWPVDNLLVLLFFTGLFLLAGLLLGAIYFGGIAQQVRDGKLNLPELARLIWGDWARVTALGLVLAVVVFTLGAPTLVVASLLVLLSPILANIVTILGATVILWIVIFGSFTLPGIVLQRRGLFGALWDSLRLVQSSVPQTTALYLAVVLINVGLGFVWNLPADDSWFLLIGLAGHALVSTALIAATFVFYKDRYRWWLETQRAVREAQPATR
jgi:hypothetical protein